MNGVRIAVLLGALAWVAPHASAYEARSKAYAYANNATARIESPTVRAGRTITFVDMVDYLPAHDDDFGFKIKYLGKGAYDVRTAGGNGGSKLKFRLNTWELPAYVQVERKNLVLEGKTAHDGVSVTIPKGHKAVTFIEVLTYWPGGDDDLAYAARAVAVGRTIFVTGICDFGRVGTSRVVLRATVLHWPREYAVTADVERMAATQGNDGEIRLDADGSWLAVPTAYMTDTSKYAYSSFGKLNGAMNHPSAAGKEIDVFGTVKDAASLGSAIATMDAGKIAVSLGTTMYKYLTLGLGPDDRDDDFWMRLSHEHSRTTRSLELSIGDGNKYALAEATVWRLRFPTQLANAR